MIQFNRIIYFRQLYQIPSPISRRQRLGRTYNMNEVGITLFPKLHIYVEKILHSFICKDELIEQSFTFESDFKNFVNNGNTCGYKYL